MMEDQPTWKGHSFTLLVFAGIVVLCSIFFVLGMLVGRSQGQKFAAVAAAEAEAKRIIPVAPNESQPELTFYESVEDSQAPEPILNPPAAVPDRVAEAPRPVKAAPPAGPVINFQVGAVRGSNDAEKLLSAVKAKGFKGFILAPPPGDPNPFYRVQVGPYRDAGEAELEKQKLVSAGYQPIKK
jgi:cell division protein FtsN